MADVFVSYAREEAGRAEEVRRALEVLGLTVFFDVERLDSGDVWSDVIDRELKSAGAVVALWSPHALSRPWVKKECAVAQGRGVLLPALLEPVNDLDMPVQFSDLQRVDISDFHGQPDHVGWRKLVRALAKTLKRNDLLAAQIEALKEEKQTAKVKAELEAAQKRLAVLRKSKGGVKPAWVAIGVVVTFLLVGAGTWWGVLETGRREKFAADEVIAKLRDPKMVKALSAISADQKAAQDHRRLLKLALNQVEVQRLIEASKVDADAALLAGWAYADGVSDLLKNEREAVLMFERSCNLGSLRGCNNLGLSYLNGTGVPKDPERAAGIYLKACEAGNPVACSNLGVAHQTGVGAIKDLPRAATYYDRACSGGDGRGCTNLGRMHDEGLGVAKDVSRAATYYAKGCKDDDANGCTHLGEMYMSGVGVDRDVLRAAPLFAKACEDGSPSGCVGLGETQLIVKAFDEARQSFGKACDLGVKDACRRTAGQ